MKDNYVYNEVFYIYFGFAVYCFFSVEKISNFHSGLLEFVGYR